MGELNATQAAAEGWLLRVNADRRGDLRVALLVTTDENGARRVSFPVVRSGVAGQAPSANDVGRAYLASLIGTEAADLSRVAGVGAKISRIGAVRPSVDNVEPVAVFVSRDGSPMGTMTADCVVTASVRQLARFCAGRDTVLPLGLVARGHQAARTLDVMSEVVERDSFTHDPKVVLAALVTAVEGLRVRGEGLESGEVAKTLEDIMSVPGQGSADAADRASRLVESFVGALAERSIGDSYRVGSDLAGGPSVAGGSSLV